MVHSGFKQCFSNGLSWLFILGCLNLFLTTQLNHDANIHKSRWKTNFFCSQTLKLWGFDICTLVSTVSALAKTWAICKLEHNFYQQLPKGQLISKADWRAINFPKNQTGEFVLFAFFTLHGKQIKFVRSFFGRIYDELISFSILSEL